MNSADKKMKKDVLISHNKYRQQHFSPPLKFNTRLCQEAQEYAERLAEKGTLVHAQGIKEGENLFYYGGFAANGDFAVDCWYEEVNKYNYNDPASCSYSLHFTQVVWKSSKRLGFGHAISKSNVHYIVCRYSPAGNMMGEFEKNVLPPQEGKLTQVLQIVAGLTIDESGVVFSHNKFRENHGSSPLTWSISLKEIADKRAQEYIDSPEIEMVEKIKDYGENFAIVDGANIDGKTIVNSWYKEGDAYNYTNHQSENTQHFTQIIWKSTTEIGYCKKQNGENGWIFVAIYSPKGNVKEEYSTNVLPPVTKKSEDMEPAGGDDSTFIKTVLDQHNVLRSKHDASPLKWAKVLAIEARKWVEYLISKQRVMKDSASQRGQIVDFEWESDGDSKRIIQKWYNQEVFYNYLDPKGSTETDSFTQIVWSSSTSVGLATGVSEGMRIWVSLYWPPGNISGLYSENVAMKVEIPDVIMEDFTDYQHLMEEHHNLYRIIHRSKKVRLSDHLSLSADILAKRVLAIVSGEKNFGFYSKTNVVFNYIISKNPQFPRPSIVCRVWYSTGIRFEYDNDEIEPECRPFCEMLWRTTRKIGVGAARNKNRSVVVVVYDRASKEKGKACLNIKRPLEQYETLNSESPI